MRPGRQPRRSGSLSRLGDSYLAAGDAVAADQTWREALAPMEVMDHPGTDAVLAKLSRAG